MLSSPHSFTAEQVDLTRQVAQSVQVAWKKDYRPTIKFFTIGVSTIAGNDLIPNPSGVVSPANWYIYNDESAHVMALSYERELNMPGGGLVKGMADVTLDNTSGRYTPRFAGGSSELFTAILPRRPIVINAGFHYKGVDQMIPQFVGITDKAVAVDTQAARADLSAMDFIGFLQNRFLDTAVMFTSQTFDRVAGSVLAAQGLTTAQYNLDVGVNTIQFGLFLQGTKLADMFDAMVKAEYGHMYQDEEGILRFENRQHYNSWPYTQVQKIITTSQVINAKLPSTDQIVNVVEVTGSPRSLQSAQLIWQISGYGGNSTNLIQANSDLEIFANYNDPVFVVTTPVANGTLGQTSYFVANTQTDGSGVDYTGSVYLKSISNFAQASKIVLHNNASVPVYISTLDIWGQPARKTGDIYYRSKRDSSVTAYEERVLQINSDYIQDETWAQTLGELILDDFASPNNLMELTIRAMPTMQIGDLISYQGRYWRIYGSQTKLDPSEGFLQTLKLVQRTEATLALYFRIGMSTIGSSDKIAP